MEEDVHEAEALGFKAIEAQHVKVGDEVAYYNTMFEVAFTEMRFATVTRVWRPHPYDYPELIYIYHTGEMGSPAECEEGDPVWVKRTPG